MDNLTTSGNKITYAMGFGLLISGSSAPEVLAQVARSGRRVRVNDVSISRERECNLLA